jgi:hypothetical protein
MSRRPLQQPPLDTIQPEVPEDELLSATGEGDEVMEEAEEQEGYSACVTLSHYRALFTSSIPFLHPTGHTSWSLASRLMPSSLRRLTRSIIDTYVILDLD